MQSLWSEQSLKPTEIILVEDGVLTEELYAVIEHWENSLNGVLKRVPLKGNKGLGKALNIGLQYCQYEYVARMDTDDICVPYRFEKQVSFLKSNPETDVLGGQIKEFNYCISDSKSLRALPTKHTSLLKFAKKRSPFNHPSVIYRKSVVQNSGSYQDDHLYEDYALWVRMICNGARIANTDDVVLYMRSGSEMFHRRGGFKYAKSEIKAQVNFYKMGFLSAFELVRNLVLRVPVRLLPNSLRAIVYKIILRS